MAERAKAVQESFEDRQTSTEEALAELLKQIERDEERKKTQAAKGLDGLTYFVLCKLTDEGVANAETVSKKVRAGVRRVFQLAAEREGAARTAEEGDLRHLCRGRRSR